MKVTLINKTQDAEDLLIFTKSTRLNLSPGLLDAIRAWPPERKVEELDYMAKTIKSSWEFVDVTFLFEGVTRAGAQQITRTRAASYAMQSQRVTDARGIAVTNPYEEGSTRFDLFNNCTLMVKEIYSQLVDDGSPLEDARGILPMNTNCNIVAKYNLRAFTDLIKARKSLRAQGEYNEIALEMERLVLEVWPWSAPFFKSDHQVAIEVLEDIARRMGITTGSGFGWEIAKAVDLLRKD